MKRIGTATLVAMAIVVASASAAAAHYVYEQAYVWWGGQGKCVHNYTETSHGANGDTGGYSAVRNKTYREELYTGTDCSVPWHLGPKYKRNKWHWMVFKGGQWGLCKYTKWIYNSKTTSEFQVSTSRNRPGCGEHFYGTHGHVQNRINRSDGTHDWVGGPMWSGCHWLPANGSEQSCSTQP